MTISEQNGIHTHIIPSKKFKTVTIQLNMKAPLNREVATQRAILPLVLKKGTKSYPSESVLQDKLDDLYGATLTIGGQKMGDYHILSFELEVANQKYIGNEDSILEEAFILLQEVLFHPNAEDGQFNEAVVNREKTTLANHLQSIQDNKMTYANLELINHMCEGETYQIRAHGYEEDLDDINAESLFQYYTTAVNHDEIDIYVVGDVGQAEVEQIINNNIQRPHYVKREHTVQIESVKENIKPREVVEVQSIQQAKLHIGYRTHVTYKDSDFPAAQVFNGILGAFPNSKLFINVREKHSLAYYANSFIDSFKGILIIYSGIDGATYEQAQKIINEQIDAIRNGQFTEEEMSEIKSMLINQIQISTDNAFGIIHLRYQQVIGEKERTPEQLIAAIKDVTKEDVTQFAQAVELDTTYLLTSEEKVDA